MSSTTRTHCRAPEACKAKGNGHCIGCSGARVLADIAADPERAGRRQEKAAASRQSGEYRALQGDKLKRLWANPEFRARITARARLSVAAMVDNEDVRRKRSESVRRSLADPEVRKRRNQLLKASLARKMAAQAGIPVELVPLYREIRNKVRATPAETKAAVLASREAMALLAHLSASERLRAAGPAPAIGTPARAAWSRKVNALPSRREAHPC